MPDLEAIEVAKAALSDVSHDDDSSEDIEDVETAEQLEDEDAESEADSEAEKESKSQRRRRLRREKEQEANRKIVQLETENERLRQRAQSLKAPDPRRYTSDAEYAADLAAYKVRKQDIEAESQRINADYTDAETTERGAFSESVDTFMAEGTEKYQDFQAVAKSDNLKVTTIMAEAIMESDLGVDVLYYLGKHPKEAAKIADLSPVAQARAIFGLEGKVKAQSAPPRSEAPPPVKPVRGGSAAPAKPVSQMSMSEYAAYRQKQIAGER